MNGRCEDIQGQNGVKPGVIAVLIMSRQCRERGSKDRQASGHHITIFGHLVHRAEGPFQLPQAGRLQDQKAVPANCAGEGRYPAGAIPIS